jgi:hypothetical protein
LEVFEVMKLASFFFYLGNFYTKQCSVFTLFYIFSLQENPIQNRMVSVVYFTPDQDLVSVVYFTPDPD